MLKFLTAVSVCLATGASALALQSPAGRGRASMSNQMMAAPRAAGVVSTAQIAAAPVLGVAPTAVTSQAATEVQEVVAQATPEAALAVTPEVMQPAEKVDMRETEKAACRI